MKRLLMVGSFMLLVMISLAQVKPRTRTTLPIKKTTPDTTTKTTEKKAAQAPAVLTNRNVKNSDLKPAEQNPPAIGNKNIQNIQQQKEIKKAGEAIKNTPKTTPVPETKPLLQQAIVVLPKTYKLKITTTEVQCIKKSNKHPIEEYKMYQTVSYVTQGKAKVPSEYSKRGKIQKPLDYNQFRSGYNRQAENRHKDDWSSGVQRRSRFKDMPENAYILTDNINQKSASPFKAGLNKREGKNIDHSFTYTLTESEVNDPQAKMIIHTSLGEYSGRKHLDYYSVLVFDYDADQLEVSNKDVLAILTGKRKLNANKNYFDADIAKGILFDDFGGFNLNLSRVDYPDNTILEGPIRKRTTSGKEKAAVWVRFELVK